MQNVLLDQTDFEDCSPEEQMERILQLYKLGLELVRYRSLPYRILARLGHGGAQHDQVAYRAGEKRAVQFINCNPERQELWKRLCAEEPDHSPAKRFLSRLLRPVCTPLPELSPEERQRGRAENWFLRQRIQHTLDQLNEAREELLKGE